MSDEELSITEAAAQLSSHFMGCMPDPVKSKGGLVETRTDIRAFTSEASFDAAMTQHAFEGIEEAEIAENGFPVEAKRKAKRKSSKTVEEAVEAIEDADEKAKSKRKSTKRKSTKAEAAAEKPKSAYALKKERKLKEAEDKKREAFMAEARRHAQKVAAELRDQERKQAEVNAAIALAATPTAPQPPEETSVIDLPPVSDERVGLRETVSNLTDPDRMHRRRVVRIFGIRP